MVLHDRFVVSGSVECEIERLWKMEQQRRAKPLVNGNILSAVSVSPLRILGRIAEYRHFIAQRARPELFEELRIRPVAVSGLLECADGLVFGRRAEGVTQEPRSWELVPSGGIDPNGLTATEGTGYLSQLLKELREEIGVESDSVSKTTPFCLVDDPDTHVLDIGVAMLSSLSGRTLHDLHRDTGSTEYGEIRVVPIAQIEAFIGNASLQLVPVSALLIQQFLQ
jgi:hypothetical protein